MGYGGCGIDWIFYSGLALAACFMILWILELMDSRKLQEIVDKRAQEISMLHGMVIRRDKEMSAPLLILMKNNIRVEWAMSDGSWKPVSIKWEQDPVPEVVTYKVHFYDPGEDRPTPEPDCAKGSCESCDPDDQR